MSAQNIPLTVGPDETDPTIHNGQKYQPLEFPIYRSLGNGRYCKIVNQTTFINLLETDKIEDIAHCTQMAPGSIPNLMAQSTHCSITDFMKVYLRILKRIENDVIS
jgi:hypothetical protein